MYREDSVAQQYANIMETNACYCPNPAAKRRMDHRYTWAPLRAWFTRRSSALALWTSVEQCHDDRIDSR